MAIFLFFILSISGNSSEAADLNYWTPEIVTAQATNQEECFGETKPGDLCKMPQFEAEKYCESIDKHLPTTRDFAKFSEFYGAKGILEEDQIAQYPGGKAPEGYYKVENLNPNGQLDSFYFNHIEFSVARSTLPKAQFWTASVVPSNHEYAHVFYSEWGGGGGKPEEHKRTFANAVLCISN